MDVTNWDHQTDALVVGSGAGALVAALVAHDGGARTLVVEGSDRYGGSSAMSGGGLWIPCNRLMGQIGFEDSPEEAFEYLCAATQGIVPPERMRAYIQNAPEMVEYLLRETRVDLMPLEYPDYYAALPGWRGGGRALEAKHFHARQLGDEFERMRNQSHQSQIMGRMAMTLMEIRAILGRAPGWLGQTARLALQYWTDLPWRLHSRRDRNLAMGNALVGMLRRSLMDRQIPLWLESPARELIVSDGRVVGARIEQAGRSLRVRAQRGVFLACGGFEANQALREKYLPHPTSAAWTCANPRSQGDAIEMGRAVGARLAQMDDAWWTPVSVVPGEERARMSIIELSMPGGILVNSKGRRFLNESLPYTDIVDAIYAGHSQEAACVPAWLVFDATYRRRYPVGPILQSSLRPDWSLPRALREEFLVRAGSLRELAGRLGIDPDGLEATVARVNGFARSGVDLDFQRGETPIERHYSDARVKPNPCLAPLEQAPYYAIAMYPGELGTKGGLATDEHARVLREDDAVIEGLYAFGNCSVSVMGRTYPGPGSTLGATTTFGYIAARHALGVAAR
jgi:3-oxosteroid 1-dehydrogenase